MKKLISLLVLAALLLSVPASMALSAALGVWLKYAGNPVLAPSAGGWDNADVSSAFVMVKDNVYQMWYTGASSQTNQGSSIGYATSPIGSGSGIFWTRYGSAPVLPKGSGGEWDSQLVSAPVVLYNAAEPDANKRWKMWYSGLSLYSGGFNIGLAYSPDGVHWTKYADNPVLRPDADVNAWDGTDTLAPWVIYKDNTYAMWYAGKGQRLQIGYATSSDGITWQKHAGNPVLGVGQTGTWESAEIAAPSVIFRNNQYQMWYQGRSERTDRTAVGEAVSPDGVTWTRNELNPILEPGSAGAWDGYSVYYPRALVDENGFMKMYFHAEEQLAGLRQIGLAVFDPNLQPTPRPGSTPRPTATPLASPTPTQTPLPCFTGDPSCMFMPAVKQK